MLPQHTLHLDGGRIIIENHRQHALVAYQQFYWRFYFGAPYAFSVKPVGSKYFFKQAADIVIVLKKIIGQRSHALLIIIFVAYKEAVYLLGYVEGCLLLFQ